VKLTSQWNEFNGLCHVNIHFNIPRFGGGLRNNCRDIGAGDRSGGRETFGGGWLILGLCLHQINSLDCMVAGGGVGRRGLKGVLLCGCGAYGNREASGVSRRHDGNDSWMSWRVGEIFWGCEKCLRKCG